MRIIILVFVAGAALMALEIVGSRVLAPYFGSSIFVWGSLIGIFLGAMSGGYWLGGWLSERWPRQTLLNALLAMAGAFVLLLPLWAGPLCRLVTNNALDLGPRVGPLTAARYTGSFHLARLFVPQMRRVLFIGGGIGAGPRPPDAIMAAAEHYWGSLGRTPHTRAETELFDLHFHASGVHDAELLIGWFSTEAQRSSAEDFPPAERLSDNRRAQHQSEQYRDDRDQRPADAFATFYRFFPRHPQISPVEACDVFDCHARSCLGQSYVAGVV